MLDRKFSYLSSKWVRKQQRQLITSTIYLAQELLMNVQWWFKKFCKGDEILEDEERSGQPPEVGKKQLRRSLKLILLQLQEKLLKNSMLTILCRLVFWSKLERWKSSIRGGLMSWPQKKKKKNKDLSFWSVVLSYSMQQRQTISWSDCDMRWKVDFIQQPETTSSVFEWRRRSKALPKAKLAPQKGHGHMVFCLSDPW